MDASDHRIPFGLKNGVMVGISEVDSGLACGCICSSCGGKLQAKKGKKNVHHFSHDPSEDTKLCESPFETAVHKMAKQILSEEREILLPELYVKVTVSDNAGNFHEESGLVEAKSLKSFDSVEIEKCLDDIRPDVIAYHNSTPFLIEIAVTHFSDRSKIDKIRNMSISAIEIDISDVDESITKEELKKLIIDNVDNKNWISNPAAILVKQQLRDKLNEKLSRIKTIAKGSSINTTLEIKEPVPPRQRKSISIDHGIKFISDKKYDPRWFVCETCRYVFKMSQKSAPYTINIIACSKCDHPVSAKI